MLGQAPHVRLVDHCFLFWIAWARPYGSVIHRQQKGLRCPVAGIVFALWPAVVDIASGRKQSVFNTLREPRVIGQIMTQLARIRIKEKLVRIEPMAACVNVGKESSTAAAALPSCGERPVRTPAPKAVQSAGRNIPKK